jgi:KAP family P-loop domain
MTVIFEFQRDGPQTHALVVGVGHYPHLGERGKLPLKGNFERVDAAQPSAAHMADWLCTKFDNPTAPLGTVDLLVASDPPFIYGTQRPPQTIEAATMGLFKPAFQRWFERIRHTPDDIGVFYFCGHALGRGAQSVLMLADVGASESQPLAGAVDFRGLFAAMTRAAGRQIYFIDASPLSAQQLMDSPWNADPLLTVSPEQSFAKHQRLLLYLTGKGGDAYPSLGLPGEPSFFSQSLVEALENPANVAADGYVKTDGLAEDVRSRVQRLADENNCALDVESVLEEPFAFHHAAHPEPAVAPQAPAAPQPAASSAAAAAPPAGNTEFVDDDAEIERDELGRGVLAIALGRRLHKIWRLLNHAMPPPIPQSAAMAERDNTRAAFVMHLDAPWGGGKTTIANFVARVMNPYGFEHGPESFLRVRYGDPRTENLSAIFLQDPPSDGANPDTEDDQPEDARRPWIIVPFNAWQVEHVSPPWWVFYQTIRKRCFASVLREGTAPVDPKAGKPPPKPPLWSRVGRWLFLWICEYGWRLTNPKITTLLLTALVSSVALALLYWFGIVGLTGNQEQLKAASDATHGMGPTGNPGQLRAVFDVKNGIGLILAGITTIGAIWGFGALITESIIPGTDTLAERLSLGSGDPFERFRRHFYWTIARVRRPVLVIVDDIDRCKPDFIVDLIRGMQTLLRSPRVVIVILGDRDWIERAFENHHKAMNKVSVGPEQTFGARFVEKAIQMSFILPEMPPDRQLDYVRRLLREPRVRRQGGAPEPIKLETKAKLREVIQKEAAALKKAPLELGQVRQKVKDTYDNLSPELKLADPGQAKEQVERFTNEELAIRAAVDEKVEQEISHRLDDLAAYLPPNPRQIKRIINAVTMYYAVALQHEGLEGSDPRWFRLALWIIVMTEWPETWRLLACFPELADIVLSDEGESALERKIAAMPSLPGSVKAVVREILRIRSDAKLIALIRGGGRTEIPLNSAAIRELIRLTPLHSGKARLSEPNAEKEAASGQ